MHPLFFVLAAAVIIFSALYLARGFNVLENKKIMFVFMTAMCVTYITRMVLFYPNTEPMAFNEKSLLGIIISALK